MPGKEQGTLTAGLFTWHGFAVPQEGATPWWALLVVHHWPHRVMAHTSARQLGEPKLWPSKTSREVPGILVHPWPGKLIVMGCCRAQKMERGSRPRLEAEMAKSCNCPCKPISAGGYKLVLSSCTSLWLLGLGEGSKFPPEVSEQC